MRHCVTSTSVGIAPQHLTDLEHVQWVNLRRAESCSVRPPCSSEHRESNVRQWHSSAVVDISAHQPRSKPTAPPTACCGLVVSHTRVPPASVRDIKQTQKHNAATTATVAIRVRRSPQLPTCPQRAQSKLLRVHWMRRSTVSSDATAVRNMQSDMHHWFELACACQSKGGATRLARIRCISHIILTSLHCLPLVHGGKREHVRFSAGL